MKLTTQEVGVYMYVQLSKVNLNPKAFAPFPTVHYLHKISSP